MKRLISRISPTALAIIPGLGDRITQTDPCQRNKAGTCVNWSLDNLFSGRVDSLLTTIFAILTGLALILLIWAGIQYITSLGNQDAVKAARRRITNIFIAIVLLVAAYGIVNLMILIFNGIANRLS